MCQGRSNARVALNVGIKAGIHNFRRLSYRLFLRVFLPTLWGFPTPYAGAARRDRHLCNLPIFVGRRAKVGSKLRSVLPLHRSQGLEQLLLDLHNLPKSDLGWLGGIGALQTLQVAL